jgi:hypothetical protein
MNESEWRLDGNAAAGLLEEVFPFESTLASALCAHCGATSQLATALVYDRAPGLVVRCRSCEGVLIRIARQDDLYWLDLQGVRCLELREG